MAISVLIDEKRVVVCYNAGMTTKTIASRFGCSPTRIRGILLRHGLIPIVTKELPVDYLDSSVSRIVKRRSFHPGLGD